MSRIIDFNKQKKEYLTIKLRDKKQTTLLIGTPTKEILQEFIAIQENIENEGGADAEAINDLYHICAKVMSFNKGGIKITGDYLSKECEFDLEDIYIFYNGYMEFLASVTSAKN